MGPELSLNLLYNRAILPHNCLHRISDEQTPSSEMINLLNYLRKIVLLSSLQHTHTHTLSTFCSLLFAEGLSNKHLVDGDTE